MSKQLIIHDVRSHYNVGAMFRTADGAGFEHIYLSGLTPSPIDRFGRPVPEIHKTALGAERVVPWQVVPDVLLLIEKLKAEGIVVVAVEQDPASVLLADFKVPEDVAYLVGSETEGVPREILEAASVILELPMLGQKESLNVSVAAGIVMYHS